MHSILNNRLKIFVIALLLLLFADPISADSKTKLLKPKNAKEKVTIIISGKNRSYYPLIQKESLVVTTKGPGKLKIITRAQIKSQQKKIVNYSVYYSLNGSPKVKAEFDDVNQDVKSKFKNEALGSPGTGEELILELGRGEHTIEVWQASTNPQVVARFLFTPTKETKINWVSLSVLYPNEPVSLVTNEDLVTYYRFSSKKPLKIRITGPTTLRILSRVENQYQMKGRINYRLQVKEDGEIKNTYMLSSVRSEVTVYRKGCGRIPGKAREIVVYVPKGKHIYEVIPLDKDKDTILARVLFPKKDVKLKE
jgi:hypothetical protein